MGFDTPQSRQSALPAELPRQLSWVGPNLTSHSAFDRFPPSLSPTAGGRGGGRGGQDGGEQGGQCAQTAAEDVRREGEGGERDERESREVAAGVGTAAGEGKGLYTPYSLADTLQHTLRNMLCTCTCFNER